MRASELSSSMFADMMVVLLMQSISGDNDHTQRSYMSPFMAGMLSLPCRPCAGPQRLK